MRERESAAELVERTSVKRHVVPAAALVRRRRDGSLTLAAATMIAGSLGHPSKMPGYSYGLDAWRCHRGSVMVDVPGSVCSGCYARSDFYRTKREALIARERRHAGLDHPLWVEAMVTLIGHYCRGADLGELAELHGIDLVDPAAERLAFFRWHDSGDLQSIDHLRRIVAVCERTPEVRHWLPTREYEIVAAFVEAGGVIPPNLVVRLSALMIDAEPPRPVPGVALRAGDVVIPDSIAHLPTSTVHTPGGVAPVTGKGAIVCRAVELRDNQCGPCRACWDRRVRNVSYGEH
jgi:hypothetical protein